MVTDLLIYAAHFAFWGAFAVAHVITSRKPGSATELTPATTTSVQTAPNAKRLVAFHSVAFGLMYMGIGEAVFSHRVPERFAGQRILGATVIALGAALAMWARLWFHSWRFQAKLDVGHRLATGGPFQLMRHPIYMALNLLALGSALWIPSVIVWLGFVLMVIGSDLRGRAEERVLTRAFGTRYTDYCARTRRFVPSIY